MNTINIIGAAILSTIFLSTSCSCAKQNSTTEKAPPTPSSISPSFEVKEKKGTYDFTANSLLLEKDLRSLAQDQDQGIRQAATDILAKMPAYKVLIGRIPHMVAGKQLDFIMHLHYGGDIQQQELIKELVSGEKTTKQILIQNQYPLIAVEQPYENGEINFAGLPSEMRKICLKMESDCLSETEMANAVEQKLLYSGIFQFMKERPGQTVFGYESTDWDKLLSRMEGIFKQPPGKNPRLDKLFESYKLIYPIRSELALARTLDHMDKTNQSKAVLIMGFIHIREMRIMAEATGLQSKFFVPIRQETQEALLRDL